MDGRTVSGMDAQTVKRYGFTAWITRAMRDDAPLVDSYLRSHLASAARRDGRRIVEDTMTVEWRSRESDPIAMELSDLPDDDPRRQQWERGDLFFAVVTAQAV